MKFKKGDVIVDPDPEIDISFIILNVFKKNQKYEIGKPDSPTYKSLADKKSIDPYYVVDKKATRENVIGKIIHK